MGTGSNVAVRDEVSVLTEGRYAIKFRYRAESADVTNYDLYVMVRRLGLQSSLSRVATRQSGM